MLRYWKRISGTYSEELSCENSITGVVIGKSPESSSDHQEAECQTEEDHDKDDVCSEGADEEDEWQNSHEEQPERYENVLARFTETHLQGMVTHQN
jgi:hypothetical protein